MRQADHKRALVTGGAGFIGSHIARKLLGLGMEVSVVDDLSMGRLENLPEGVRFFHGSVLDERLLKKALTGVDAVFHNAARVSIRNSFEAVYQDAETNVLGTVNLLRESGRAEIKKFIFASSMAVYGDSASASLGEESPKKPVSPYGISKLAAELYTERMSAHYGFESVVLRYFNTFGPRQTLTPYVGVITIFINNLLAGKPPVIFGDGRQIRDFIFVDDVADANILAMQRPVKNAVINIGTGKGTSVEEIAGMLVERINPRLAPAYAPPHEGEPGDSVALMDKARQLLGFEAKSSLKDKIDTVIEWNRIEASRSAKKMPAV